MSDSNFEGGVPKHLQPSWKWRLLLILLIVNCADMDFLVKVSGTMKSLCILLLKNTMKDFGMMM